MSPSRIKSGRGKFCSHKCRLEFLHNSIKGENHPNWKNNRIYKACPICNKQFFTYPHRIKDKRGQFCSKTCKYIAGHTDKTKKLMSKLSKGRPAWNKGKIVPALRKPRTKITLDKDGYVLIYKPEHPFAKGSTNKIYVLKHRFVMEQHIGRYLKPTEIVHHINKNRQDNSIENLILFPSNSAHIKFHYQLKLLSTKPTACGSSCSSQSLPG